MNSSLICDEGVGRTGVFQDPVRKERGQVSDNRVNTHTRQVVKPPRIAGRLTHIECRIVDTLDTGDHTIFVGEVVAKSGDSDAMKDGAFNERIEPLFHLGGKKFLFGREQIEVDRHRTGKDRV
jgi:flavin reductase (DIM6/NTAB) family NADH-FMN oxidoreductase RutF